MTPPIEQASLLHAATTTSSNLDVESVESTTVQRTPFGTRGVTTRANGIRFTAVCSAFALVTLVCWRLVPPRGDVSRSVGSDSTSAGPLTVAPHSGQYPAMLTNDQPAFVEFAEEKRLPCGGECSDKSYTCVIKKDESYSQCVDCGHNYKYTCQFWDNDLRWAAEKYCLVPCLKHRPTPSCGQGPMYPNYARDQCFMQSDGTMLVNCAEPDPTNCGTGASAHKKTGKGTYSLSLQATLGPGVATSFYLYTFGQNESKTEDWNSITFTIYGKMCSPNKTLVSTGFAAGEFDASALTGQAKKLEHESFISLPFDACADWHTFTIIVTDKNVSWVVDDETYRTQDMSHYKDMVDAIHNKELEARFSVWAQNRTTAQSGHMGFIEDNNETFPLGAWFANIYLPLK